MTIGEQLKVINENTGKVYEAGYAKGHADGAESGAAYYDSFWDAYQDNGKRTIYRYGFAGYGWTDDTFKPKYNIAPDAYGAIYLFSNSRITDLKQALAEREIALDVSKVKIALAMFEGAENLTQTRDFRNIRRQSESEVCLP